MLLTKARLALVVSITGAVAQDTLGLSNGYTSFNVGGFEGSIVKSSQTLASLNSSESGYNFLPTDRLPQLAFDGAHHIGDVTFRYKSSSAASWTSVDSASSREPVNALEDLEDGVIAAADLSPTLGDDSPLRITREWLSLGDHLGLRINITSDASSPIELGSLGMPICINNIFTARPAEETQQKCSFADPYIGSQAGYVQITPLAGTGNAMVVAPLGNTSLEAWRFLDEPQGEFGYQSQTYEGNYEWQVHSSAYAQNEWDSSRPWNPPTAKTLQPGEVYSVGLQFALAPSIETIEDTVMKTHTPLAVGLPGYIVPNDLTVRLILNYSSPVSEITTGGAFSLTSLPEADSGVSSYKVTPTGAIWGRTRVTVTYQDGKTQTIHYYVTRTATEALSNMGEFFTTEAYFNDSSDPFGRSPSIMTYDNEVGAIVEQDGRVWIAGISDEGGTGAYLAAAMKQFAQPNAAELAAMDEFIHETVVGSLQQDGSFGVVASVFFYEPDAVDYDYDTSIDWGSWASWDRERAYTTRRAYNYIHPTAAYWSMYRIARNYPDVNLRADWAWYLGRAYNTTQYCLSNRAANCDYGQFGLMGEWVTGELLEDLKREDMTEWVTALEDTMQYRAELWSTQAVPFGSEMAWDSTGQEGVYYWTNYFGLDSTATKAINSILAYMPTVAHWGWNGNARRYWDFIYGAKLQQIERQLHHYGSGLNSLPMLSFYERNPTNLYALRVGYGGNMAPLSNIHQSGFASAAFHSYPELLKWDPYSGDYGPGFLGMSLGQCVYILSDTKYGTVVFGGNTDDDGTGSGTDTITVEPKDTVRRRVFVADLSLKMEISAGAIDRVMYDKAAGTVELSVVPAATDSALQAQEVVVWLSRPGEESSGYEVEGAGQERGGWVVDLASGSASVTVSQA